MDKLMKVNGKMESQKEKESKPGLMADHMQELGFKENQSEKAKKYILTALNAEDTGLLMSLTYIIKTKSSKWNKMKH
jgi:hypothetical protein